VWPATRVQSGRAKAGAWFVGGAVAPLAVRLAILTVMPRTPTQRPIEYRDRQSRVWYVSEVAQLKVVSAAIDGPNLCLVIRFEREGEERFARWIGGDDLARAGRATPTVRGGGAGRAGRAGRPKRTGPDRGAGRSHRTHSGER
jgi:CelD/BcsL family acetyltransferase involved in cellulose biosynthesis